MKKTKTNDEIVKLASSMTCSQAIDEIVNLLQTYRRYCKLLRHTPESSYEVAVLKAISCIGFADGFKRAYQETGNEVKQS